MRKSKATIVRKHNSQIVDQYSDTDHYAVWPNFPCGFVAEKEKKRADLESETIHHCLETVKPFFSFFVPPELSQLARHFSSSKREIWNYYTAK